MIGVSRNPQTVGRAILRDLLGSADDTRPVYAVNRNAPPGTELDGVPVHRSVLDIPGPVDLAVIAVPEGPSRRRSPSAVRTGCRAWWW